MNNQSFVLSDVEVKPVLFEMIFTVEINAHYVTFTASFGHAVKRHGWVEVGVAWQNSWLRYQL